MHTEKLFKHSFIILHYVGLKCLWDQSVLIIIRKKNFFDVKRDLCYLAVKCLNKKNRESERLMQDLKSTEIQEPQASITWKNCTSSNRKMERNPELPSQRNLKTKQDLAQIPKQKAGSTKAESNKAQLV